MRLALLAFSMASLQAGNFRASAVKVDITPTDSQWLMGYAARQSTGVHDRIYHRIVAMDDGTTQFFLVSSELCVFSPVVYDEVAAELKQQLSIEKFCRCRRKQGRNHGGEGGAVKRKCPPRNGLESGVADR